MKKIMPILLSVSILFSGVIGVLNVGATDGEVTIPTDARNSVSVDIAPEFLDIESYIAAIDTNGEYMYALVDSSDNTKVICQQYTLDGTATGKSFDVTTLENGAYKFRTLGHDRHKMSIYAENGIVVTGLVQSNVTHIREAAVCRMDFTNTQATGVVKDFTSNTDNESFSFEYKDQHLFVTYYKNTNDGMHGVIIGKWNETDEVVSFNELYDLDYNYQVDGSPWLANGDAMKHLSRCITVDCSDMSSPIIYTAPATLWNSTDGVNKYGVARAIKLKTVNGEYELDSITSTDITSHIGGQNSWEASQIFISGDKVYIVSSCDSATDYAEKYKIVVLNKNTMEYVTTIAGTKFADDEYIIGAAPVNDDLALITTDSKAGMGGKRLKATKAYIYFLDDDTLKPSELIGTYTICNGTAGEENPNLRLFNVGFTENYVYASAMNRETTYNSNAPAEIKSKTMYFEKPMIPSSTETVDVSGGYMAGVDPVTFDMSVVPTEEYTYVITAMDNNEDDIVVSSGVSSQDELTFIPSKDLAGKTLSVKAYYNENGVNYYDKGVAQAPLYRYDITVTQSIEVQSPTVLPIGGDVGRANAKAVVVYYKSGEVIGTQLHDYYGATGALTGDELSELPAGTDNIRAYLISGFNSPKIYSISDNANAGASFGENQETVALERLSDSLNLNVDVNSITRKITVKGISPDETADSVVIMTVTPDGDSMEYIGAFESNADGTFSVSYTANESMEEGEEYKVYAYVGDKYSLMRSYFYYEQPTIDSALDLIESSDAGTLYGLLTGTNSNIYNIDFADYNMLGTNSTYQETVMAAIAGNDYPSVSALQMAFYAAVNSQKEKKEKDDALEAIRIEINGESENEIAETITAAANAEVLGYNQAMYGKLIPSAKSAYITKWLKDKNFANVNSMLTAINDGLCVEYVNTMQYETVVNENQIQTFKSDLGLLEADVDYYEGVGADAQKQIIKNFVNPEITQKSAIPTQFTSAISAYKSSLINPRPQGSGVSPSKPGISSRPTTPGISAPAISPTELIPQNVLDLEGDNKFEDVVYTDWYFEAICELAKKGVVEGITDTRFEPQREVTREEFVKMIVEAFSLYENKTTECNFSDTSPDRWYYTYVASAYSAGIIDGYENGAFGVGDSLTREDMSVIIAKTLKLINKNPETVNTSTFSDMVDISDYAKDSVVWLHEIGVLMGMDDGKVYPKSNMTRAMAAQIIYRLINLS